MPLPGLAPQCVRNCCGVVQARLGEDQEWANKTANWFVGAWNTVKSWFSARDLVISSYSDWYRVGWGLGNDGSKPTSEWVARDFHITPYRLYKQQVTFPYTFELGIRVSSMKPARTYEFATTEPGIYTQMVLWNGDWSVGFNDPSDEPRVVEIRTRND
ncbi:hypothetical protein FOZG_14740 [Fusarium oxysporum Fo47]|uniref:Uncharacterized protein n=1 Tax=Fusarium oxysporum Fo47 TaxID=660027 RepID=W9JHT7_FUSOX|nr:hypothetical protein FOZG_14740 [Fusarium oxysporum Fo47]